MSFSSFANWFRSLTRSPYFWILLAGLAAHGAALWSCFYMDDYLFIVQGDDKSRVAWKMTLFGREITNGATPLMGEPLVIQASQLISTLLFDGIFKLFGASPVANHAANLLVHLFAASLVLRVGRIMLRRYPLFAESEKNERAALFAALVFVVHPLCSEPVNYAKCLMLQLVVAFGLWSLARFLIWLNEPTLKNGILWGLLTILCIFSYFPGTVIVFAGVGLILLIEWRSRAWRLAGKKSLLTLLITLGLAFPALHYLAIWFLDVAGGTPAELWQSHLLTQSRVFWMYFGKVLVPIGLCSDHFITWSASFSDISALIGAVGILVVVIICLGCTILSRRVKLRSWMLVTSLAVVPLLYRFLYCNYDAMVEYRTYPAMPWFSLLIGGAAAAVYSSKNRGASWAMRGVVIILAALSCARSQVWHEHMRHCDDVLASYPLNNRARAEVVTQLFGELDWKPLSELVQQAYDARTEIEAFNKSQDRRAYSTYQTITPLIYIEHYYSRYLAMTQGVEVAVARLNGAISSFKGMAPHGSIHASTDREIGLIPLISARKELIANRTKIDAFAKEYQKVMTKGLIPD